MTYIHVRQAGDLITLLHPSDDGYEYNLSKTEMFPLMHLRESADRRGDQTISRAELVRELVPHLIKPDQGWELHIRDFLKPLLRERLISIEKYPDMHVSFNVYDPSEDWLFHATTDLAKLRSRINREKACRDVLRRLIGENGKRHIANLLKIDLELLSKDFSKLRYILQCDILTDNQIAGIMHYALSAFFRDQLTK